MGIGPSLKSCGLTPHDSEVRFPNPNPARFTILSTEQVGSAVVAEVLYPDCTNYEGRKVLVYADMDASTLRLMTTLDPHFSPHGGPLARFEPTMRGYRLAVEVAKLANGFRS